MMAMQHADNMAQGLNMPGGGGGGGRYVCVCEGGGAQVPGGGGGQFACGEVQGMWYLCAAAYVHDVWQQSRQGEVYLAISN